VPDQLTSIVPIVHAGATWFMVGLIWFVQVVHYPLMAVVPASAFQEYANSHQRLTTWVVGPVMLVEAATALAIALLQPGTPNARVLGWTGLALLGVVWASTFFVQVPLHGRLSAGLDLAVVHRLVATNWVRTVAWTARGIVAAMLLREACR
jgi:hypothetical protein